MARPLWISVAVLCGTTGPAASQARVADRVSAVSFASPSQDVPQDVRIMRTIVRTALSEVEAPELPKELAGDSAVGTMGGTGGMRVYARQGSSFAGSGDVSGFYMQDYGYLFTVHWPVSSLVAFRTQELTVVRPQQLRGLLGADGQSDSEEARKWAGQYRERLADALVDVIAGYGSTLRRAGPGEAITFIADFGGGDDETVTMTVKVDALQGSDLDAKRSAVQISTGQGGVSERLRTQLKIMSQIVDTSLRSGATDRDLYVFAGSYFGGSADAQYVPGYGVIFRKNARMSTSRTFMEMSNISNRRAAVDSVEATARKTYREHLDTLRHRTGELLATYGPTLTELKDDDWVGLFFDVGSAAGLLNSGMNNYLVQARMRDIRQAANQSDPAGWLETRLVTNEKED